MSRISPLLPPNGRVDWGGVAMRTRPPQVRRKRLRPADTRPPESAFLSSNNWFLPPLSCHDVHEVTDLLIDVVGFRHGLRHFFTDDFGLPPSEPENRRCHRAFTQA